MWNSGGTYKVVSEKIQRRNGDELLDSLDISPQETVLDYGCGTGAFFEALALKSRGGKVFALDISESMLAEARRSVQEKGLNSIVIFPVCGPDSSIPLPDGSVDAVFSNAVLHWVRDKRRVFSEFGRVLKDGGRVGMHVAGRHASVALDRMEPIVLAAFRRFGVESSFAREEMLSKKRVDLETMIELGEAAGFSAEDAQLVTRIQRFPGDEFLDFCISSGDMYFHRCPESVRASVIEDVKKAIVRELGNELVHSSLKILFRKLK